MRVEVRAGGCRGESIRGAGARGGGGVEQRWNGVLPCSMRTLCRACR